MKIPSPRIQRFCPQPHPRLVVRPLWPIRIRAEITKRLIREQGFGSVAVEADWPDAYRVNRYVRGRSGDADALESLGGFQRFPQWMWRNADVLDFVGWLRAYNDERPEPSRVGSTVSIYMRCTRRSARCSTTCGSSIRTPPRRAVEPLEHTGLWERGEVPETYPSTL